MTPAFKQCSQDSYIESRAFKPALDQIIFKIQSLALVAQTDSKLKDVLVLDSGCNNSIVSSRLGITEYSQVQTSIQTAGLNTMKSVGRGLLQLNNALAIPVLHAPEATANLISIHDLAVQGFTTKFSKDEAVVQQQSTGKIILRARESNGLYVLPRARSENFAFSAKSPSDTWLAHRRLGHLNFRALPLLAKISTGLKIGQKVEDLCEICSLAKSKRKPFHESDSHASEPGELVYSDICGDFEEDVFGYRYFQLIIDDFSRHTTIFLLTRKSEAKENIIKYDNRLKKLFGKGMSRLRTDGGSSYGDFYNKLLSSYCDAEGIHQESAPANTSVSNARAERPNRTVVEGAAAMLIDAGLPDQFWSFAVTYFVWIKNRSPHAALYKTTPHQLWTGEVPDLSNLHVFGVRCFANITHAKSKGFSGRGKEMIFVGKAEHMKADLVFDLQTNQVLESRDVDFKNDSLAENFLPRRKETPFVSYRKQQHELDSDYSTSDDDEADLDSIPVTVQTHADSDNADIDPLLSLAAIEAPTIQACALIATRAISDQLAHEAEVSSALEAENPTPTVRQAMAGMHRKQFTLAIQKEYASLAMLQVLGLPQVLPAGKSALGTKMVLKIKETADLNAPKEFKARLCVQGFRQVAGIDYHQTYAPVAAHNSLRVYLSLMAMMDYEIDSVDVSTAFLHGVLKEEIYIKMPDGYPCEPHQRNHVIRLHKTLYGLKQSPMEWNSTLHSFLVLLGFKNTLSERCIYTGIFGGKLCYILLFVDDMLLCTPPGERQTMAQLKHTIHAKYPLKDKGPLEFFLNMHFGRNRAARTLEMMLPTKIDKLVSDLGLTSNDVASVPANPDITLTKEMCPDNPAIIAEMAAKPFSYKAIVGRLLYIAITCRPDIAQAVSAAGRYAQNPGLEHWDALVQITKYLNGTRRYCLTLGGSPITNEVPLCAYSDADWGGDKDKFRSRTGYCVFIGLGPVIWCSKLQASNSLSSTEAEYISLSTTSQEVIWARTLLIEMGFQFSGPSVIFEDNNSCISIAESYKQHPGVKHIALRYHFIRDRILEAQDISLERKATGDMVADLFTKALRKIPFAKHRFSLNVRDTSGKRKRT